MTILAAASFAEIFPNFEDQIQKLFDLLLPVGAVLMITGLLSTMRYAYTPRSMMRALMTTVLITAALALWSDWMNLVQESTASLVDEMDASPSNTAERYIDLVTKNSSSERKFSILKINASFFIDLIVTGFLSMIGLIASAIIWVAYIIQKFFLGFAYAFAPLFLGMLALRSTNSIGLRYIMATVGILVWPVGWAAASVGTSNLIDIFVVQRFASFGGIYSQQAILGASIIGAWIIISTLVAPIVIQKVIASGANVGAALTSGGLTATADAGKAGLGAAATIAATGATGGLAAGAMVAGGAAAAASSTAGSTMRGGGGGLSGHSLQSLVPKMHQAKSQSQASGGSTGGQASSQAPRTQPALPSPSSSSSSAASLPPPTPANDLSFDQRAAEAIEQSRPTYLQQS